MSGSNTAYVDEKNSARLALSRQIFSIESRARDILGSNVSTFDHIEEYRSILIHTTLRGHEIMESRYANIPDRTTSLLFRELRRTERFSWVDAVQVGIYDEDAAFEPVVGSLKPHRLFAALALTLIDELPFEFAYPELESRICIDDAGREIIRAGKFEPMPNAEESLRAAVQIAEAMEAICIAENLHHKDQTEASFPKIDQQVARKISEIARRAAKERHKENYALRDDIFAWCETNMGPHRTIDSAAEEVSKKVVPVKFRFAQKCISEWKKLQSARRA